MIEKTFEAETTAYGHAIKFRFRMPKASEWAPWVMRFGEKDATVNASVFVDMITALALSAVVDGKDVELDEAMPARRDQIDRIGFDAAADLGSKIIGAVSPTPEQSGK